MTARYPRRTIALGPPFDDGTYWEGDVQKSIYDPEAEAPTTRVQFGPRGITMPPDLPPLTVETLAAMLHEQTVGCYADDRCLEPEHRFKPSGNVHTFDAGHLLPVLEPYLHRNVRGGSDEPI